MRDETSNIRAAGAELVVIGNGKPHFIKGFRETTRYQGLLYTDPSRASYRIVGLKRGFWRWFNLLSALYAVRALVRGHLQRGVQGDAPQQGGVFIVRPDGELVFSHIDKAAGGFAPAKKILSALARANQGGEAARAA